MKKAAISLMAWVAALQMNAVPANPKPFTYTQPDGTSVVPHWLAMSFRILISTDRAVLWT